MLKNKTQGIQVALVFLKALPTEPTASWMIPESQARYLQAFQ